MINNCNNCSDLPKKFRIGIGHDIHGLIENRPFILGGVTIPFNKGLNGHSDADALIHAIIDALLGAVGLDDIGTMFPDSDIRFKDASSIGMLSQVIEKIHQMGYIVSNLDTIIHCERPKLAPYKKLMRENIAKILGVSTDCVSIKAGTNEGFDSIGRGEAVACQAVVLLTFKNEQES